MEYITFKNCESLYCTPITYIILYSKDTSNKKIKDEDEEGLNTLIKEQFSRKFARKLTDVRAHKHHNPKYTSRNEQIIRRY